MNNTLTIRFKITQETKEQLDRLYQELNRPVTYDELLAFLLRTYYRKTAESALFRESEIGATRLENEVTHKFGSDFSYEEPPQVRASGQPMYTRSGVWYSPVEPRVSR